MKTRTRPSLDVCVVDTDKLATICRGVMTAQYGETEGLESLHVDDLIIGKIVGRDSYRDNDTAIVCTEGVGYEADAMGRISVPYEWNNKVERGGWVDVSAYRIWNECRTDDTVDLAEFVRVFGDRLETNHDIWRRAFTVGGAT